MTEETLFHEALALPAAERAAFLERACAGRPQLRAAVEALLAAHEASGVFLDRPPADLERTVDSEVGEEHSATLEFTPRPDEAPPASGAHEKTEPGVVIAGRYTLVEKIGEGGMGEVWVAKQTEPVKRKVALKLIKAGMDSRGVLARFEQERQALALMDHPNIARVYDAGVTASGQPFFVMELVNGLPLTQFCDQARLTPRERLELFVPICQAVQHAHMKGIVHRDLKPANILVTMIDGRPVPKVIDFGVAKATGGKLTDETLSTQFGAIVGTLEYMSPEQAGYSGQDVDTRADIYSLGVILYELLTGLRPIDARRLKKAALVEMVRLIQEEEPSRPSTRLSTEEARGTLAAQRQMEPRKLAALLRGELDWVVMKCLEKQRDRRYDTAAALARDVQRYLGDEPVEARPPSAAYRLQKFLRRNFGVVVAVAGVAAALLLGTVVASWQAVRATSAEFRERTAREEAEGLASANAQLAANERNAKNAALAATREKDRQLIRARANLFTTQMTRVAALRDKDPAQALELLYDLEACPVELRDAAWRFSVQACSRWAVASFKAEADLVALSPDGKLLAVALSRREIRQAPPFGGPPPFVGQTTLFEVPTGKVRTILPPFPGGVGALAFSPDGRRLAVASGASPRDFLQAPVRPGKVLLWDVPAGKEAATLEGHTDLVVALAFSPAGGLLATGSKDGTAKLWDAGMAKERATLEGHTKPVTALAFTPDGKRLATGALDNTIRLWDAESKKLQTTLTGAMSTDPMYLSFVQAFRDRGSVGASGSYNGTFIDGIIALAFSPDGKTLVSGNANCVIEYWDAVGGRSRLVIRGEQRPITALRFHPDGKSVFSSDAYEVKRWDANTGQALLTLRKAGAMSLSGDGTRLVTAFLGRIDFLDVDTPVELATLTEGKVKGSATAAVFSGPGDVLAVACGDKIYLWNVHTGKLLKVLEGHKHPISGLALAPDGCTLASSGSFLTGLGMPDGGPAKDDVRLWDIRTGESLGMIELGEAYVPDVAFSPDGLTLATICQRSEAMSGKRTASLSLWDLKTRKLRVTLEEGREVGFSPFAFSALVFSPDGRRLAVATGREVGLWDVASRKLERRLEVGGGFLGIQALGFTPDGRKLAASIAAPSVGPAVYIWDPATGALIGRCRGASGPHLAFTPNGKSLLSLAQGQGIALSDVETAQVQDTYQVPAATLALSPDGRVLATAISSSRISNIATEGKLEVKLWDLSPARTLVGFPGMYYTGRFVPDGKTLAVWKRLPDEPVELWDLDPVRPRVVVGSAETDSFCKTFSPDGRILALGGSAGTAQDRMRATSGEGKHPGQVSLWDTQTGKNLRTFEVGRGLVLSIAFSPDGKSLALTHSVRDFQARKEVGEVTLWDLTANRVAASFPRPENHGRECAFSADGQFLALGCDDGSILLRDLKAGTIGPALKGQTGRVVALAFNADGTRLYSRHFGGPEGDIGVAWDWRAGQPTKDPVPDDSISPDGRFGLERTPVGLQLIDRTWQPPRVGAVAP